MNIITIGDIEILEDDKRYYILYGWKTETYNNRTFNVPVISKEIDQEELDRIEKYHFRHKKLIRVLKDDISGLIKYDK